MTKKKTLRHRGVVASDSISEMIAQIQNGLLVGRNSIAITRNSTTMQVANILLREGYIAVSYTHLTLPTILLV